MVFPLAGIPAIQIQVFIIMFKIKTLNQEGLIIYSFFSLYRTGGIPPTDSRS
ncbi:hypothetical protein HOLDEFILI_01761 [Holdemania filiformis DSM 12042]|uniref:Uncharacterized protein n=1 Tax=Holdemania filiformis DSM 12042 TaxID=545696 RepID=B9Y7G5_9FIRM|nr:hypothetical protein HOLDEFILI_01761 [Holdemania filiformis DSM 12042]